MDNFGQKQCVSGLSYHGHLSILWTIVHIMDKCPHYGLAYLEKSFEVMISVLYQNYINIKIKIRCFVAKLSELDLRTLVDKKK